MSIIHVWQTPLALSLARRSFHKLLVPTLASLPLWTKAPIHCIPISQSLYAHASEGPPDTVGTTVSYSLSAQNYRRVFKGLLLRNMIA